MKSAPQKARHNDMTKLSVNINKVATLRNARGGNVPDVEQFALDCERYGAQGITVHPRPDERHIRRSDVFALKQLVSTEFNIEGNPTEAFTELVCTVKPTQVTLVPDAVAQLTSDHGWDTLTYAAHLAEVIRPFKAAGIRVSVFVDADPAMVEGAAAAGADRIELYTGPYAEAFASGLIVKILPAYVAAAKRAKELGLGVNAGHDLNTLNLPVFLKAIPWVDEVSIGHALIADALYWGIEKTIGEYLKCCK